MANLDDPRPGFRWPVAVGHQIAVPAATLWDIISSPGSLEQCHPFCDKNPVERWPGVGSRDQVHYLSGWVFERHFVEWIEGIGYDLEIGRSGEETSFVSWRIAPIDYKTCTLRIAVYPHLLQGMPVAIRWVPHLLRVRPQLRSYLTSVVRGFEWYATKGQPVPRNQFGSHPWFSKA